MRVIDPLDHLAEVKEILVSRGFTEIPTKRVQLPEVPVLAAHTKGFLEATFTKENMLGNVLDAKVYSTKNHNDDRFIGIRSVYRDGTAFDIWYFSREQDILFKRARELQGKLFKDKIRTKRST